MCGCKVAARCDDQLKSKLGSSVIVLASVLEGKVVLVAGVSDDLVASDKGRRNRGSRGGKGGGRGGGRADSLRQAELSLKI